VGLQANGIGGGFLVAVIAVHDGLFPLLPDYRDMIPDGTAFSS
jgi:hypothetical protein